MVIKWSALAKENLKYFLDTTLMEKHNAKDYIKSLVNFMDCLLEQQYLGKILKVVNDREIRQIIYKKHRILYYIEDNQIYIIALIHTLQSLEKTLKNIKKFFK